jgi:hypothetical protein
MAPRACSWRLLHLDISQIQIQYLPMSADQVTNDRIVLSRHTLAKYEQMPMAAVQPEQTLGLLRDEVKALREIIARHPEKSLSVGDLVKRWEALADELKAKTN